eukprot:gb/GECG01002109.1/.p1 GENE.gb/GECG01002109.1/~~gb/GECG01002109.1/.p1  ORF type:complete len:370 (+),score=45.82 gb/GECG01002109.1/:1-1110(+)
MDSTSANDRSSTTERRKVLVLASLTDATGNAVTAQRLVRMLNSLGFSAVAHDANLVKSVEDIQRLQCDAAIGIHGYRAGKWLVDAGVPYIIVLGGTDVNVYLEDSSTDTERKATIYRVLTHAKAIVSFNDILKQRLLTNIPDAQQLPPIIKIPQAVELENIDTRGPSLREMLQMEKETFVVLHPAGLRAVKDPSHVLDSFQRWASSHNDVALVLVGPILDEQVFRAVADKIGSGTFQKGVVRGGKGNCFYHTPVERSGLLKYISESNVVINTSKEEGMANTILEAMASGKPVIARANSGNKTIIKDRDTGWLYETPEEFIEVLDGLYSRNIDSESVCANAKSYIREVHSFDGESTAWADILLRAFHSDT